MCRCFHAMSAQRRSYRAESAVLCMSPISMHIQKGRSVSYTHLDVYKRQVYLLSAVVIALLLYVGGEQVLLKKMCIRDRQRAVCLHGWNKAIHAILDF